MEQDWKEQIVILAADSLSGLDLNWIALRILRITLAPNPKERLHLHYRANRENTDKVISLPAEDRVGREKKDEK